MNSRHVMRAVVLVCAMISVIHSRALLAQISGMALFEQAYAAEDKNPAQAAELYRRALSSGLSADIAQAARWKLFYVYRKLGDVEKAVGLLVEMGPRHGIDAVYDDLRRDVRFRYRLTDENVSVFLAGIRLLGEGDKKGAIQKFKECSKATEDNLALRVQIVRLLTKAGEPAEAAEFLQKSDKAPELLVLRAESLLVRGQVDEAESIARDLAESEDPLEPDVKFKVLYLLGRITRDRGNYAESVAHFRLAADYASGRDRDRQVALAALSLYRAGFPRQAKALYGPAAEGDEPSIRLLAVVLRYEVDHDVNAFYELVRMRASIEKESKGKPSFVQARALEIASRRNP